MSDDSVGNSCRLKLEGLAIGGEAVGRLGDLVVFVPFGAPGDDVEVRISEMKKNYARGEIFRIFKPSPHRVEPLCPIYYKCGGCQLQHLTYGAQLIYKRKMVQEALKHLGGINNIRVDDVIEASDPWYYRNKMQVVAASKPFLPPSKKFSTYFGLYAKKTHRVIKMDECVIQHPLNNKLLKAVKDILAKLNWETYNENTGDGLLRYLISRVSITRDEILLTIVTTSTRIPQQAEFVNAVSKKIPQLKGIIINKNDRRGNVVLGTVNKVIWGEDFITEEINGIKYRVSQDSFFQVNPPQAEKMFRILDEFLNPDHREILLDAYCGVGAISLWLAGKFRKVIGIEEVPQAKKDALKSAEINDIANMEVHAGLVEKILPDIYHKGIRIDKAVLDPPRKGCEEQVLDIIAKMRVRKVVYVSCNPATLARDLSRLMEKNYRIEAIRPLDMFPQTHHVECIVKLVYAPPTFLRKAMVKIPESEVGDRKPEAGSKKQEVGSKRQEVGDKVSEKGGIIEKEKKETVKDKTVETSAQFIAVEKEETAKDETVETEKEKTTTPTPPPPTDSTSTTPTWKSTLKKKKTKSADKKKKTSKKTAKKTASSKKKKKETGEKKSEKKSKTGEKKSRKKSSNKKSKSKMKDSDKKSGGSPE